jgi:hypothetical protein
MGDLYRKGAFPRFMPNENIGIKCFKIASMCPDGKVAGIAQMKFIEAYTDGIAQTDKQGEDIPVSYAVDIIALAEKTIKNTPWHMFETPKSINPVTNQYPNNNMHLNTNTVNTSQHTNTNRTDTAEIERIFDDIYTAHTSNNIDINTVDTTVIPQYKHDAQNVHDHGIVNITKKNIEQLKINNNIDGVSDFDPVVHAIIELKDVNPDEKMDALHVIEKMTDHVHSSFHISEKDALRFVWKKIMSAPDNSRNNLIESLAKQLASAVENGYIVCSSGKISRIMATLDGYEHGNTESVRPMWAIKDEIGNIAAKIRSDGESTGETTEYMMNTFKERVLADYVQGIGLNKDIIQPIIDDYLTGF